MRTYILSLITFLGLSFVHCANELEQKEQTLRMTYIAWACDCANWATNEDMEKYGEAGGDTLADLCIFIEPADRRLELPDTLGWNNDVIEFTGSFYKRKGFPAGYSSPEPVDKAKVFRYTRYKIIKSTYRENQDALKDIED